MVFQLLGLSHVLGHRLALLPSSNLGLPDIHDGVQVMGSISGVLNQS